MEFSGQTTEISVFIQQQAPSDTGFKAPSLQAVDPIRARASVTWWILTWQCVFLSFRIYHIIGGHRAIRSIVRNFVTCRRQAPSLKIRRWDICPLNESPQTLCLSMLAQTMQAPCISSVDLCVNLLFWNPMFMCSFRCLSRQYIWRWFQTSPQTHFLLVLSGSLPREEDQRQYGEITALTSSAPIIR